jgi:hypothetical protein
MDDYNSDKDDNIEMQGSYKDLERTSRREIDVDIYIDMFGDKKRTKLFRSDIEIFVTDIVRITKELIDINVLTEKDQDNILENMGKVDRPEFKNSTAYILGYIVSQGGIKISKEYYYMALTLIGKTIKDEKIKKISNENIRNKIYSIKSKKYKVEDNSVESPDIIRYGRLWLNMYDNL